MKITIHSEPPRVLHVSWLNLVKIVAASAGYKNVDVEPFPTQCSIEATGPGMNPLLVTAKTLTAACQAFYDRCGK